MARGAAKIRLFVEASLGPGASVALGRGQSNYLAAVMRLGPGDEALLFNGRDGEWRAEVAALNKRAGEMICAEKTAPQSAPPDLWLLFAPIKKARTDFIVEKATELGTARIQPVFTQHTNSERVNIARLQAHSIEAAEQCGLTAVPEMAEAASLDAALADWPEGRKLMFCDETAAHGDAAEALRAAGTGPWAILIGPEGGFSAGEAARLRALPFATPVSLGPRILRADTAAAAALTLWQSTLGDWR